MPQISPLIDDPLRTISARDGTRPRNAVSILAALGIGIGFVLLIVPGLVLLTLWSVVAPVAVIERPGVFSASAAAGSSCAATGGRCSARSCSCSCS